MNKTWTRGDVARDPIDGETVKVLSPYAESPGTHEVEVLVLGRLSYGYAVGDVVLRELDDPAQPFELARPFFVDGVLAEARTHDALLLLFVDMEWMRLASCAP